MTRLVAICLLCWIVLLAGCSGPKKVEAKGRIVSGGQPLKLGPQAVLNVQLVPKGMEQSIDLTAFSADIDGQGTFSVYGGVPPGTYKFVIQLLDPYPLTDKLKGKFSMDNSPIEKEVTGEPLEIDIGPY
jgi:hypothetical protein